MEASLQGVTVVETGSRVAASVCGLILRELGADVIVLDGTPGTRDAGPATAGREVFDVGKRTVALDMSDAGDREALRDLVGRADVVLLSSDVSGDVAHAAAVPDRQIRCDITAFGAAAAPAGKTLYITESESGSVLTAQLELPGRTMFSHM